ncbi:hypothetical protein O690_01586 [Staphylococcus aureus M0682]|nr:hypothetical protein B460_01627 [Staphylococcus aureus M0673]EUE68797.1 hypothetical protein O690_01586 [Staphylococcus aureus M0682]EUE79654.1 hypothetical protein O694_01594 [Staphylococcus aureus M0686]
MCIKKSRKFYLPTIKDEEPNKKPGESVTVTVIRDGKTKEVKVKLKQQKEQPKRQSRSERQSPGQGDRDFFR